MPPQANGAFIAALGIQLQLAGSLLCLGLGLVLQRGIGHRPWMTWWAWSYGAMAFGITALLVRYNLVPLVPLGSLGEHEAQYAALLYTVYLAAKLLWVLCLFYGTWLFVWRKPIRRFGLGMAAAVTVLLFVMVSIMPGDLNPLMAWQGVFCVPVFLACAWLLSRLPEPRRTRGSRVLQSVFLGLTVLWILYVPAFGGAPPDSSPEGRPLMAWLSSHNSYIDVLFEFLLGFGMILAVLDDVYAEAERARLARLTELADSEGRLAQIIRAASDGIVLLDAERRIMHANPAALEILRFSETALLGQPFDRIARGTEDLWAGSPSGPHSLPSHEPGQVQGVRADGAEFPMEVSLSAMGRNEPEGYVLILRDRTQRARMEEERDRMQAQLAHAARLETIGRMVSGVAHELNNPLTAILAFAQDLLQQSRTLTDTEAITTIVQQAQRCRSIVQDLLTFARTKREDRQSVTAAGIVDRVRPAFEREAAARGIHLEIVVPADLPPIHANPAAMEQVLTNLLSNAFDAVEAGGGSLVRVAASVEEDHLALVVEDDGIGLSSEVLPRLFEPFFTTKEPGRGTGLGLSVSHGIVEQHGGTLRAGHRAAGVRGAQFMARLPFMDRRAVSRDAPLVLPHTDLAPGQTAPRRVLVVDDEAPIRVAIRRYLERRGWVVDEARDGREALDRLGLSNPGDVSRCDYYDAIVTDLRMPGVSGIEVHARIEEADPAALDKVVLISGDTGSAEIVEFLDRLRKPIVQKPFDMRTLADLLDRTAPPGPRSPNS